MYRVYCLNYIFNESQVNMTNTNFVTSLLRCYQLFLEWVQITKYFQTHCTLLKFIIRDMLFPTKLTSLINTLGLIDSASLENHHNNRRDSGSHKWPKTFFGRCIFIVCMYPCFVSNDEIKLWNHISIMVNVRCIRDFQEMFMGARRKCLWALPLTLSNSW